MFAVTAAVWGLVLVSAAFSSTDLALEPSIGDVRLATSSRSESKLTGTVEIYYNDGLHGGRWGRVCAHGPHTSTADVICRQMGYSSGDLNVYEVETREREATSRVQAEGGVAGSDAPPTDQDWVWLSSLSCKESANYTHVLRCQYNVSMSGSETCMKLIVTCHDHPQPYDGQVRLCPHRGFPNDTQSVSFGLVQVYLNRDWGGVNQFPPDTTLSSYDADSICRQLGYTNAIASESVTRMSASDVQFDQCYRLTNTLSDSSWLNTSDKGLTCTKSEDCFGCCFSRPSSTQDMYYNTSRDVVVKCEFDPTIAKDVRGGSSDLCKFDPSHQPLKVCAADRNISWQTFWFILGPVSSLAVLLLCALCIVSVCWCWRCHKNRNNGGEAGRGQRGNLLRQQDDEN